MIVFENPGEADVLALTTFGVNVKEGDSPIGFFGTGFKYAIAVLLRTGHEVEVYLGEKHVTFRVQKETIRGKEFGLICMDGFGHDHARLGFTTELGKHWEVWMAYRELWSNARDEGGRVYACNEFNDDVDLPPPHPRSEAGTTRVLVSGEAIERAHVERAEFLLEPSEPPVATVRGVEFHRGSARAIFYRGIKVMEVPEERRTVYTYNLLGGVTLTEDRTAKWAFEVEAAIRRAVAELPESEQAVIEDVLTARRDAHESKLDWRDDWFVPGDGFKAAVAALSRDRLNDVNISALEYYKKKVARDFDVTPIAPTPVQEQMIVRARALALSIGFGPVEYPVILTASLGEGTLAVAVRGENKIYLSSRVFAMGTKYVALALIEEYLHLKEGLEDCSRGMQTFLLEKIVTLAEELAGEPV